MVRMLRLTLPAVEIVCNLTAELNLTRGVLRTVKLLRVKLEVVSVVQTLIRFGFFSSGLELLETNVI